jgi:hypothetical protein
MDRRTWQSSDLYCVLSVHWGEASHTAPGSPSAAAQALLLRHVLQSTPLNPSRQAQGPPPAAAAAGCPVKRRLSCCWQLPAATPRGEAAISGNAAAAASRLSSGTARFILRIA